MIRLIAQYRLKEGVVEDVLPAIKEFVEAVEREEPDTEYHAYRLDDSREFLHVMAFPDQDAAQNHREAEYTAEFVDALYPNCEEEPQFASLHPVG